MELYIGQNVTLVNEDGGELNGTVTGFGKYQNPEKYIHKNPILVSLSTDAAWAIITPSDSAVAAWFVNGIEIGRAHWDTDIRVNPFDDPNAYLHRFHRIQQGE